MNMDICESLQDYHVPGYLQGIDSSNIVTVYPKCASETGYRLISVALPYSKLWAKYIYIRVSDRLLHRYRIQMLFSGHRYDDAFCMCLLLTGIPWHRDLQR